MEECELLEKMKALAISESGPLPFPIVSEGVIAKAEEDLGFPLPKLLRLCYLHIGNGGFGPGLGLIGLEGGADSDHGTLVETYRLFRKYNRRWKDGLLPFCKWGANMYSCIACKRTPEVVYFVDEGRVDRENTHSLPEFFEMWIEGKPFFPENPEDIEEQEIINPATQQKDIARTVRRKQSEEDLTEE